MKSRAALALAMLRRRPDLPRGIVAGLLGGLVASWAMNQFQFLWGFFARAASGRPETPRDEPGEDTTVRTAHAVSEGLLGRHLTAREEKVGGPAVHYVFGTAIGGAYGAGSEKMPAITRGAGLPFGAVFWLVADETAVPLLRLSEPPHRYPISVHLYALLSHLVYGSVAEGVRRMVRARL